MSELTLEQELAKAKDELETAKATVKFYEDQVEQQAEWAAEDAKIATIAAKFPWIFSTHLGAKPIDPVLRAQDDADPDDWDWETGAPKAEFMTEKLGHPVTEDEAMACLAYYKAFNAGKRGMPRPTFAKGKDQSILGAVKGAVEDSKTCETGIDPDAQWFLPVPSQSILDFRVVELKGDYWLFWHDDSHANDGMLPGFDEENFKAKVYLLLEIEHYADPVSENYWSCGMRSPYKIPKEAIDRHFISLRYRWMTDPNDYNIMSGHWGEKTLTTNGAGTFEQLLEEGISQEYILSQSIEQFNQIRGVPGTLTYAPGTEPIEVGPRGQMEQGDLMAKLLEDGPESWVVDSVDDLPDWYWTLDEFEMNAGNQWGKIQIAPGHFVYYDGSGPRGRWNVPAMQDVGGQEVSEYTGLDSAKPSAPDVPFEAGELEYRDIEYPDGRKMKSLVLPVKILEYPDGFDQMIGRSWITKDSHVSLSALEARLAGMRYTETVTDAPELTFILSSSYKWQDMSPVKLTFYFRKKDVMLKKSEGFELTREVPGNQVEQMPLPLPPVAEDYVKKEDLDTAVDRAVRKAIEQL